MCPIGARAALGAAVEASALREPNSAEQTRRRIVLAALRLFAQRGFDAVPVRDILEAAGQRNQSAVHYHFGSKQNLLDAVLAEIHDQFDPFVQEALSELDALKTDGSLRTQDVVMALVAPLVALYHRDEQGRDAIRLMSRLLTEGGDSGQATLMRESSAFLVAIDEHLARLLPEKPREKLRLQILLTAGTHLFGLIALNTLKHSPFGDGELYGTGPDHSVQHAVDLSCVGLLGD